MYPHPTGMVLGDVDTGNEESRYGVRGSCHSHQDIFQISLIKSMSKQEKGFHLTASSRRIFLNTNS
jgi:hypothetical protein